MPALNSIFRKRAAWAQGDGNCIAALQPGRTHIEPNRTVSPTRSTYARETPDQPPHDPPQVVMQCLDLRLLKTIVQPPFQGSVLLNGGRFSELGLEWVP